MVDHHSHPIQVGFLKIIPPLPLLPNTLYAIDSNNIDLIPSTLRTKIHSFNHGRVSHRQTTRSTTLRTVCDTFSRVFSHDKRILSQPPTEGAKGFVDREKIFFLASGTDVPQAYFQSIAWSRGVIDWLMAWSSGAIVALGSLDLRDGWGGNFAWFFTHDFI